MEVWILLSDAEHCRWRHLRLVHDPALVAVSYPQRYVGRGYGNTGDDRHYRGFPRVVQLWVHGYRAFVRGADYFQHLRLAGQRQFRHQRLGHLCLWQEQGQADHQRRGGDVWLDDPQLLHHDLAQRGQFFRIQFHHGLSLRHQRCDRHRQGNGLPRQNGDQNHHVFGL